MKRFVLVMVLLYGLFCRMYADTKTFVREYYYQASEADSKITAREKSLTEVKKLLLEELGVYMESYVNFTVESEKEHISKDFFTNEIKQISVGVTETKILEENWNGEQYYIKAEISADPSEVVKLLNKTLEKRKADVVIDSLQVLLFDTKQNVALKNNEIEKLSSELAYQKTINDAQNAKLATLNSQLSSLKTQMAEYQKEEQQITSEIERITSNMRNITKNAAANARYMMNKDEVRRVCGNPRYEGEYIWNYGYVNFDFNRQGFLTGIYKVEECDDGGWPRSNAHNYIKY